MKFRIKKDIGTLDPWVVHMGDSPIARFGTWEECRALVCFSVKNFKREGKMRPGNIVKIADTAMLVIAIPILIAMVVLGNWSWTPIPISMIFISVRGLILQDYYHLNTKNMKKPPQE